MLLKRIGLFVAVIIILMLAYQFGSDFATDPKTMWLFGIISAVLLYCVKLLYDDYTQDIIKDRQYPEKFKDAVEHLAE